MIAAHMNYDYMLRTCLVQELQDSSYSLVAIFYLCTNNRISLEVLGTYAFNRTI